jgi:hypothetical protein
VFILAPERRHSLSVHCDDLKPHYVLSTLAMMQNNLKLNATGHSASVKVCGLIKQ